ncbi:MAG: peptidase [Eggerthellaceae bacterium]|nr:peptidase [Eggerthellaceae bacterium]
MERNRRKSTAAAKRISVTFKEHARNKKVAGALSIFLGIVIAFILGFALRSNVQLTESLGFNVGSESTSSAKAAKQTKSAYDSIAPRVDEVEDILTTYSMDEIHLNEATVSMLTDMMKSTEDPYAEYYDQERYEAYIKEAVSKGYQGIGVLFGDYNGRAYAIDVLEGSEAQAKGVTKGDFVEAVNGDSEHEWSASEVIGALSKLEGEDVVITWMRPISMDAQDGNEFATTLECREYKAENVTSELVDENVGYIRLRQMTSTSYELVKSAVMSLSSQGAQAFVLDIRDNPGGYLTQSLDIAGLFIASGNLVGIETLDGVNTRSATGASVTTLPLVVLMNGYTSAAAEVLAAALQDNQRATTVGQTTMGKGSVQVVRELSFGGAVRYTAAYYLTPQGRSINDSGITPELIVGATGDDDTQLLVAIDTAHSLTGQEQS